MPVKRSAALQWLYKTTEQYCGSKRQQSIDLVMFFKLILIGYIKNLNSFRKLIEHSCLRLDILYFLGYDIDELWHSYGNIVVNLSLLLVYPQSSFIKNHKN